MSVAEQFMAELRKGNLNEAIESLKAGLKESTTASTLEYRQEILESVGFPVVEKKMKEEEEESDDKDPENKSKDDEEEDK